jgi:replicative DNA helicase
MMTVGKQEHEPTIELEESVLGALMLGEDKQLPEWTQALRPEMYSTERHKQIAMAIDEILGADEVPDMITVTDRLKSWGLQGVVSTVIKVASAASTAANLGYHSRLLAERYQRKELVRKFRRLEGSLDKKPLPEIKDDVTAIADELNPLIGGNSMTAIRDEVRELYKALVRSDGEERRKSIRTKIDSLDRKVFFEPGDLTILAGRPSMGKTALACSASVRVAAQGRGSVIIFSLEMAKTALTRRILASEAGISGWKLAEAAKSGKLTEPAQRLYGLDFWMDDRPGLTINSMRAAVQRFDKIALIVVDYLGLVKPGREERHDLRIGGITKAAKAMAKQFGCHVLLLAQLNRALENRSPPIPRLSDLRDSGNIEEDADNVLLLYRPSYYFDDADPEECQVKIGKQRNGPTGAVRLRFNREQQSFKDW